MLAARYYVLTAANVVIQNHTSQPFIPPVTRDSPLVGSRRSHSAASLINVLVMLCVFATERRELCGNLLLADYNEDCHSPVDGDQLRLQRSY